MEKQYLTVTALTRYIKTKIEYDPHLQSVWLKGEISNFKYHSRGHMYFTLKDENARIAAVMFAGHNRNIKFMTGKWNESTCKRKDFCLRGEWFLSNLYSRHAA